MILEACHSNADNERTYHWSVDMNRKDDGTLEPNSYYLDRIEIFEDGIYVGELYSWESDTRDALTRSLLHKYELDIDEAVAEALEKHKYDEREWDAA